MIARFAGSLQFRYFWWKRKYLPSEFIWKEMFNKYKQFEEQWLELGNGFFWTVNKDRRKAACGTETIGVKYKVVYYCHGAKNSWQHAVGLYLFISRMWSNVTIVTAWISWAGYFVTLRSRIVYFYWLFLRGDNCQFLAFIPEVEVFLRASSSFYHGVHICVCSGTTQTFFSHDWFLGQLKNK